MTEADARRALLSVLAQQGKYAPATPSFIVGLAGILVEQGRYQEAEKLARAALDVDRTLGIGDDAPATVTTLWQLGNILVLQRKTKEAAVVYAELDKAIERWAPQQREAFQLNGSRIVTLYASGQVEAGIAAAEELVKRQTARTGDKSFDTAAARGILAIGYARAARDGDAVREFKASIPIMLAAAHENADDDDATVVAARSARLMTPGRQSRGPRITLSTFISRASFSAWANPRWPTGTCAASSTRKRTRSGASRTSRRSQSAVPVSVTGNWFG